MSMECNRDLFKDKSGLELAQLPWLAEEYRTQQQSVVKGLVEDNETVVGTLY